MAFDLSKDLAFVAEILNNKNFQSSELSNSNKPNAKPTRKSVQKPKSPNTNKRKTLQKENIAMEKSETKKTGGESKKSGREPLKVLNTNVKPTRKSTSPSVEKKSISPAKRKSTGKANFSPSEGKAQKKEKVSFPKIVVYEVPPGKAKTQKKENKKKSSSDLSKSWDGLATTSRRSHPEARKSPKLAVSKTRNVRRSLNDLTSTKSPTRRNKSLKSATEAPKKSPAKVKSRLTKYKVGQPEFEEILAKLETLFPNVDPEFMKTQFIKFKGSLSEIIEFLITKDKTNELPTRADYVRRLEMERLQNKFMENFSVENFLKIIPDPWEHFLKTERHNCASYSDHSLHYLKTKYKKLYLRPIQEALARNEFSLYLANKELKRKSRMLKMRATNRSKYECDVGRPTTFNIQFIHEVAFIENETKIKSHIKKAETARYKKFKEAEKAGTLLECLSCNDFSLLQDDVINCPANHVFCKDCVVKYVEVEIEKDNFQFKCLLKCEQKFSLDVLQAVLNPSVMGEIVKRNQLNEIKSAGINDLVCCPFCNFIIIMPPELSVFKCLNPGCMMESCRHCKRLNHLPLKCNELEKFDQTASEAGVEIEEEEEEEREEEKEGKDARLKCTNCNGEFLKREDSNQMVCPCGATVCFICRQPFRKCEHFDDGTKNESSHRLSSSSDDTDIDEVVAEDDVERSSDCSENLIGMFVSESENF